MMAMALGRFDRIRRLGFIVVAQWFGAFLVCEAIGVRVNTSPSLPIGIYRVTTDASAKLVEFCPNEPYASFAAARGYRSTGSCPDRASPLMKPVIANAGDIVTVSNSGLAVNGKLVPNTAPVLLDTHNRAMIPWPRGVYPVQAGFVWVASSYNARSFDSRYFGPVRMADIRCHLKPFLVLP
jgi:conjugative transfer signal peptidase TraF